MDNEIYVPPFLGSKVIKGLSIDDIAAYINETALFRNQWQFRPETLPDGTKETDEQFKERIRPILREQLAIAVKPRPARPAGGLRLLPRRTATATTSSIWTDETRTVERMRFRYPRQRKEPFLCIADFFRPIADGQPGAGEQDYAAFHIVTMGPAVSERTAELFAADRYQEYLLLHGLGVEMAEALAELWHRRIREEWGFADEDGPVAGRPVPPAVPRRPLLVGLSGVPGPRGQRHRSPSCSTRRAHRHRVQRGDRLPVPAGADHLGADLPPPAGQVLRREVTGRRA